jgi:hypothetical protein
MARNVPPTKKSDTQISETNQALQNTGSGVLNTQIHFNSAQYT